MYTKLVKYAGTNSTLVFTKYNVLEPDFWLLYKVKVQECK